MRLFAAGVPGAADLVGSHKKVWGRVHFGQNIQEVFLVDLVGRSFVGMRVEDAAAWTQFLKTFQAPPNMPNELHLIAIGDAAIPLATPLRSIPNRSAR